MKKLISLAIVLFFAATAFAEETLSLKWNESSGNVNQEVTAGKSITPIVFDYEGITSYSVSGLPSGLVKNIDEKKHKIMIVGSVNSDVMSGDYEYKVTVKNDQGDEKSMSGTIVVKSVKARTSIKLVSEKARQKVLAGNEIEPVVFEFANVHVDESLSSFKFEGSLKGSFEYSVDGNKLTCSGTVDENLKGGLYTIRIIAIGENNNDTAVATVDVTNNSSIVTKVSVLENATQSVSVGDSVKPIVFVMEHVSEAELTGFPGGYQLQTKGDTLTVIGVIEESAKGPYEITLGVYGVNNNASAKATINVAAGVMSFDVVEGSDNQTVVAGQEIVPIVYQYNHVKNIHGSLPAGLDMKQDTEKNQVKVFGTVDSKWVPHEYTYSFELTDYYEQTMTVTGKINVVRELSSSSVVASSSSEVASSSSAEVQSSSSSAQSSSSVESSSSNNKEESSSSEATTGIATVAMNGVKFGYANNVLTVAMPNSAMLRVQVFDMMGHLVESFAETEASSKSFNLAHLTKGNYVVRIESARSVRTARILVK